MFQAESPVYWNVKEWCDGFRKLLDYMELDKVHLFGTSLGQNVRTKVDIKRDNQVYVRKSDQNIYF